MSDIWATLIANLLPTVIAVVTALLGVVGTKVAGSINSKNKAEAAALKVAQLALSLVGSIWTKLSAELQIRLADGVLSKEDRAVIVKMVEDEIKAVDISDTVGAAAAALGLPLSSIIGQIAEYLINRWTSAHDKSITAVSAKAFPVAKDNVVAAAVQATEAPANTGPIPSDPSNWAANHK